ncbi:MAG: site-specific integrase, partial [Ignavibacteria bacterium]
MRQAEKCSDEFLTKSKKERIVPMNEKVRTILINRFNSPFHQPDNFVFYRIKGRKLDHQTISKQFKDAVRKAKLNDKIHFHSLRHSFASALAQRSVSLFIIKELLGHEDLATTQIYSH